ncbi:MAG: 16S rRNA (adenine(1518)-N(6)/adenine(1519)-N(6))-dimethyltransferase RsmA [Alphaproteobacteria bacterium]
MQSPKANKELGQHFLHDQQVLGRIAAACKVAAGDNVLEIGPGPGALTSHLLALGVKLAVLEKDERFPPLLQAMADEHGKGIAIHLQDALQTDFKTLAPHGSTVVGNLPYNVGTEIVMRLMKPTNTFTPPHFARMVFMLQKEVVLRLVAKVGDDDWGRLAVWADVLTDRRRLFDVGPGAFNPPPKVTSSVVELVPLPQPRYDVDFKKLERLLNAAFMQRRKMLRRSLKGMVTDAQMETCGIAPTQRPEELNTAQLCALANLL